MKERLTITLIAKQRLVGLSLFLVLCCFVVQAQEAPKESPESKEIRRLVFELQRTGPVEAEYVVKTTDKEIARFVFTFANPALKIVTKKQDSEEYLWLDGMDVYTRQGSDGILYHKDFRDAQIMMEALSKKLAKAFASPGANLGQNERHLSDAWKANMAQIVQIGVVMDVYIARTGDEIECSAYAHMDPSPPVPFGWYVFPGKVAPGDNNKTIIQRGPAAITIDDTTGWVEKAEWKQDDKTAAVMEKAAMKKIPGLQSEDILPPVWERKLAVTTDAFEKNHLARIAAIPLWMYVLEVANSSGDTAAKEALTSLNDTAYWYYSALLDTVLGKDYMLVSAAFAEETVKSKIPAFGKSSENLTAEQRRAISDDIDAAVSQILNEQGKSLAESGYTGLDFLLQSMGTKPAGSLNVFAQSVLIGFTRAYNDNLAMPIHGLVRWQFRAFWLEPEESRKAADEKEKLLENHR